MGHDNGKILILALVVVLEAPTLLHCKILSKLASVLIEKSSLDLERKISTGRIGR